MPAAATQQSYETIGVETTDRICTITMNRPEVYNALNDKITFEIQDALKNAARDKGVSVVVLTGAGKAFCSGQDLGDLKAKYVPGYVPHLGPDLHKRYNPIVKRIREMDKPVIAAVNGAAAGGGNELVVACDLAIAADSAKLGQTGVRVGSAPVLGGTNFLTMNVGEKRGKEIAFMCRRYTAKEAMELGWINAVVPADELEAEVTKWADELLCMSPRYLEIAKISSHVWWNQARDAYLSGLGMLVQAIGSPDMIEGATAFMEKRKPQFEGRAKKPAS